MRTRILALIAALCVVASLFLPWVDNPFGTSVVPWDAISQMSSDNLIEALRRAPAEGLVFMASFFLAAIFALAAAIGAASKSLAFLAGAAPVGLVAWAAYSAVSGLQSSGLPIPQSADLSSMAEQALKVLGPGFWAWIGGGSVLLVLGIVDPGPARRT